MKRKIIVSAGLDCSINFFSVRERHRGKLLKSIKNAHSNIIQDILPLGKGNEDLYIVTCSTDDTQRLKLWDLDTMSVCVNYKDSHSDGIKCLSYIPREDLNDKSKFCSGSWDNDIRIWNVQDEKSVGILTGHSSTINSLAFSHKYLISGSEDRTCKVWDCERASCLQTLNQTSSVSQVDCSLDSSKIFTVSNNIIVMWDSDYKSQKCIQIDRRISSVCFLENRHLLVIGDTIGRILGWDIRIKSSKNPFVFVKENVHKDRVKRIIPFPTSLSSSSSSGVDKEEEEEALKEKEREIKSVVSCSYDKSVCISDVSKTKGIVAGLIGLIGLKNVASSEESRAVFEEKNRINSICLLQVIRLYEEQIIELENSKISLRKVFEPFTHSKRLKREHITFCSSSSRRKSSSDSVQWMGKNQFAVEVNIPSHDGGGVCTIPGFLVLYSIKQEEGCLKVVEDEMIEKRIKSFSLLFHRDILTVLGFVRLREDLIGIIYYKPKEKGTRGDEWNLFETNLSTIFSQASQSTSKQEDAEIPSEDMKTKETKEEEEEEEVEGEDNKKNNDITEPKKSDEVDCDDGESKMESKPEREIGFTSFLEKWFLIKRIVTVLRYLHSRNTLHLKLTPESILFDRRRKNIKIIGYGVVRALSRLSVTSNNIKYHQFFGRFSSPEVLRCEEENLSKKSDVYSMGMIIYFISSGGKLPLYETKSEFLAIARIINGEKPDLEIIENEVLRKAVEMSIQTEPEKRPEVKDLLEFLLSHEDELLDGIVFRKEMYNLYDFVDEELKCPITKMFMKEPSLLVESGFTYERKALDKYLKTFVTDPLSDTPLKTKEIISKVSVEKVVHKYIKFAEE